MPAIAAINRLWERAMPAIAAISKSSMLLRDYRVLTQPPMRGCGPRCPPSDPAEQTARQRCNNVLLIVASLLSCNAAESNIFLEKNT
jgi:hypothetical protein